jgi:hypothetical protein
MVHVKKGPTGPFKIKGMRKSSGAECTPVGAVCSIEADDGSDKPPC